MLFCAKELNIEAHLYTMAVDGSGLTPVSDRRACFADWSSTDRIVAVAVAVAGGYLDKLVTMDPDGSNRHVVRSVPRATEWPFDDSPSWSPDGSRVAYSLKVGPRLQHDLFSVDAEGGARVRLTHTPRRDELFPLFSPEGTDVAFSRSREFWHRQSDLFIVTADGSSQQRLTDTPRRYEFSRSWWALP